MSSQTTDYAGDEVASQVEAATSKDFPLFARTKLAQFPDIPLYGCSLYDLYERFGDSTGLNYTSGSGNSIIVTGAVSINSLKSTSIYLRGRNNKIHLDGLKNVFKLEIACVSGASMSIQSPHSIRGLTVLCSDGSRVSIGAGCLISRDVLVYSSKAHGLYTVADGVRRYKEGVDIGGRVWLGQGARILAGAKVGEGSVIGSYSVLAGSIANNCAAAGNPCRVTTRNIFWTGRAKAEGENYFEMLKRRGKPIPEFVRLTVDET